MITILDDNFRNNTYGNYDCYVWFRIAKHLGKSLDEGLVVAKKWLDIETSSKNSDPRPYYYMAVIKLFQALDGYTTTLDESTKLFKECYSICKNEENYRITNTIKARDWFVVGDGMGQLLDDTEVEHERLLENSKLVKLKGVVDSFENKNSAGFIKIKEPRNFYDGRVFFKPSDSKLTINQKGHPVTFNMAFTFERLMAFNKSIQLSNYEHVKGGKENFSDKKIERTSVDSVFANSYKKALEKKKSKK